ncbi:MAG TPA: VapE family protein [Chitinophagales bacterium]|nr:VapE family protein [Chitinophagales bacterium]
MNKKDFSNLNFTKVVESVTGQKVINGLIKCCNHQDKTPSCYINDDSRNQKGYHCFSCKESGNPIDFLMKFANMDYKTAIAELNKYGCDIKLRGSNSDVQQNISQKVLQHLSNYHKGEIKILGLYPYHNSNNEISYYKVKFSTLEAQKNYLMFHLNKDGNIVSNIQNIPQIPYNCYEIEKALDEFQVKIRELKVEFEELKSQQSSKKVKNNFLSLADLQVQRGVNIQIFITEGEKDVETIQSLSDKYLVTSFANLSNLSNSEYFSNYVNLNRWKDVDIYFCGDTGQAGEKYKRVVWRLLQNYVKSFNVIELHGINRLGDNKDVSDWIKVQRNFNEAKRLFQQAMQYSWNFSDGLKWRDLIPCRDGNMKPSPDSIRNIKSYLDYRGVEIRWDMVTKIPEIYGATNDLLSTDGMTLSPEGLRSAMISDGCKIRKDIMEAGIDAVYQAYAYNHFQEICIKNRNSNHHLIDKLVDCLHLPDCLQKKLFRKWLFSYVIMGFNNMTDKFVSQGMLILHGPQNMGKSTFAKALALHDHRLYIGSNGLIFNDTTSVKLHTSRNLIEFTEFLYYSKKEASQIKNFLDKYADYRRELYKSEISNSIRFSSYIATTNETNFQKDSTGSRRFWILEPEFIVQPKDAGIDVAEVLGAIYDLVADMTFEEKIEMLSLSQKETAEVNNSNIKHYAGGNVGSILEEMIDFQKEPEIPITKDELYTLLSCYDIKQEKHHIQIDNYLKNQGITVREKQSGGLPVHKIDGQAKRSYKIPRLRADWKPTIGFQIHNRDEIMQKILALKATINSRVKNIQQPIIPEDEQQIIQEKKSIIEEKIEIPQGTIEYRHIRINRDAESTLEPSTYVIDDDEKIKITGIDGEILTLEDNTYVYAKNDNRYRSKDELLIQERLQADYYSLVDS